MRSSKPLTRVLAAVVAMLLMIPTGLLNMVGAAIPGGGGLALTTAEILDAVERGSSGHTRTLTADSTPTVTVVDEDGAVLDTHEAPDEGIHASYTLADETASFVDSLSLPFEGEDSVLMRAELLEALAGKWPVKTFHAQQAIAVIDPGSLDLVLIAVNTGDGAATFTLTITDAQGQELDLSQAAALIRRASLEELTAEELAKYRGSSGVGVELLEITEMVAEAAAEQPTELPGDQQELPEEPDGEEPDQEEPDQDGQDGQDGEGQQQDGQDTPDQDGQNADEGQQPPADPPQQQEPEPQDGSQDGDGADGDGQGGFLPMKAPLRPIKLRVDGNLVSEPDDGDEPKQGEPGDGDDESKNGTNQPSSTPSPAEPEVLEQSYVAIISREEPASPQVDGDSVSVSVPGRAWAAVTVGIRTGAAQLPEGDEGITVTFDPANDEEPFVRTVRDDGTVEEPEPPTLPAGLLTFLGWYEQDADEPFDFDQTITGDLALTARYSRNLYVRFKSASGKIIGTQMVALEGTIAPPSFTDEQLGTPAGKWFSHWFADGKDESVPFPMELPLFESVTLSPSFTSSYYVYFQSGGSKVDPQVVSAGSAAKSPTAPTRPGYKFAFWSTNPDATATNTRQAYNFNTPVNETITLYGIWSPQKVSYSVIYWVEKPGLPLDFDKDNRNNYMYAASETKTATAGTLVSAQAAGSTITKGNALLYSALYSPLSDRDKTLAGDGSTVVNVYYTRNIYTITFKLGKSNYTMQYNNQSYSNSNPYILQAKYEMDISAVWPSQGDSGLSFNNNYFVGWTPDSNKISGVDAWSTKRLVYTADMIPGSSKTLEVTAKWLSSNTTRTVNYYLESIDGTGSSCPSTYSNTNTRNRLYNKSDIYSQAITSNSDFDAKDIDGFVYVAGNSGARSTSTYNFYYNRRTYTFTVDPLNGGAKDTRTGVKYEASLSGYKPADPTRDGYAFGGWYTTPEGHEGSQFDFATATMPNANLAVYAKWLPTAHTVSFYDGKGGSLLGSYGIEKLGTVYLHSDLRDYTPGYFVDGKGEFRAWLWELNGVLTPFAFDQHLAEGDIELYAAWNTMGFQVLYELGDAAGPGRTPPQDDDTYDMGVPAIVKGLDDGITVSGMVFVGWQVNGGGATYYPGTTVIVNGTTTLIAKFVTAEEAATLTYHPNYTGSTEQPVTQRAVAGVSTAALGEGTFTRTGYRLIGWSRTEGGTTVDVDFSQVIQVDGDMDLYAVWEAHSFTVTFEAGQNGRLEGQADYPDIAYGTKWSEAGITPPEPVPAEGFYFDGWTPLLPTAGTDRAITTNLTFTANFEKKTQLTVRAGTRSQVYNGNPLTAQDVGYTLEPSLPADYEAKDIVLAGSITEVGSVPSTANIDDMAILHGDKDVTHRYDIKTQPGTLTVTKRTLTITGASDSRVYNAELQFIDSYTVGSGQLLANHELTGVTAYGEGTLPDNYPVNVTLDNPVIRDTANGNREVTGNYNITKAPGNLHISAPADGQKLPWSITAASDTRDYTGRLQQVTDYTTNLPEGYKVTGLTVASSGTDVGVYHTEFTGTYTILDDNGNNVTAYYAAPAKNGGTLEITPVSLVIKADDFIINFNDPAPAYTASYSGFVEGENADNLDTQPTFQCQYNQGDPATAYTITPSGAASGNYTITYQDGTLTVEDDTKTMEATADDVTATYDGTAHTIDVKVEGVDEPVVEYRLPGGEWNTAHPVLVNVADSSEVEFRVNKTGYATVTGSARVNIGARDITVRANSATRTHSGRMISVSTGGYLTGGSLADGQTLSVISYGYGTGIGTHTISVTATVTRDGSTDTTANYNIATQNGTLTIQRGTSGGTGGGSDSGGSGGGAFQPSVGSANIGGDTFTINDGDVPLAGLPDGLVTIEDESVPLAALPSTGGIPVEAFLAIGACLIGGGSAYKIRSRKYRIKKRDDSDN